jgi:hypothetical protein
MRHRLARNKPYLLKGKSNMSIRITKSDCDARRKVKLRGGKVVTLHAYSAKPFSYPVLGYDENGTAMEWTDTGVIDLGTSKALDDIVSFVEEEETAPRLQITEKDIGRKVNLRNGDVATLTGFDRCNPCSVQGIHRGQEACWTTLGWFGVPNDNMFDIVSFVEEPAFTITEADCKAKRKVKLRSGTTVTLSGFNTSAWAYPVEGCGDVPGGRGCWTVTGQMRKGKQEHWFDIVSFVEPVLVDLTMEEIGRLVGTHKFKYHEVPGEHHLIIHNLTTFWAARNQAAILIAPVDTEDWKPTQKEVTNA